MSDTAVGKFAGMLQGMQKAIKAAPIVAAVLLIVGAVKKLIGGIGRFITETSDAYIRHRQELAKIGQILQSTGAAAWTTTRQLREAAVELSNTSGRTVDEILGMQSVLLTFGNVTGETFYRAQQAIADMAAVMGGDLAGAARNVGRALEDPAEGMRVLARQGVILARADKERVEALVAAGQQMAAQKIILEAMERSFGGVAAAINDVNAAQSRLESATKRLKVAQGEATTGIRNWWADVRAGWREARAEAQEFRNAVARAERADHSRHIAQLENLREVIERINLGLTDFNEWEIQITKNDALSRELEIERKRIEEQIILIESNIQRRLRDARAAAAMGSPGVMIAEQRIVDGMRERQEALRREIELLGARQEAAQEAAKWAIRGNEEEQAALDKVRELERELAEIQDARARRLEEIARAEQRGLLTAEQARAAVAAAWQAEANAINVAISQAERLTVNNQRAINELTGNIGRMHAMMVTSTNHFLTFNEAAEQIQHMTPGQFSEFLDGVEYNLRRATMAINDNFAHSLITAEEHQQQLINVNRRALDVITAFTEEHRIRWGNNTTAFGRTLQIYRAIQDELSGIADAQQNAAEIRFINEHIHRVNVLNASLAERVELERQWALRQLRSSDVWKNANANARAVMENLVGQLHRIEESTEDTANNLQNWINGIQVAQQGLTAFSQLMNTVVANQTRSELDAVEERFARERELMEETHQRRLELYEEDLQNRLFFYGLARAATEQQHERELNAALQTGNHRLIFRAHQAKREFQIRKEYEQNRLAEEERAKAEREALELKAARDRAKIEHRAAMIQWAFSLAQTKVSVAQSIMQAFAQLGPLGGAVGAGVMGGIGAIKVAEVLARRPQMQTFAEGGIVRGNPFRGDATPIMAKGREMVLTDQDQTELLNAIRNGTIGGEGVRELHLTVEMDGEIIAKKVFEIGSLGNQFIRARGVIR